MRDGDGDTESESDEMILVSTHACEMLELLETAAREGRLCQLPACDVHVNVLCKTTAFIS